MAILTVPVALFDVRDIEAFVQATINRSRRRYEPDEREELVAEGLRIAYDLASRFDPHRDGYEQEGRFSGFLAKFLPLKLEDAYHRLHPEHVLRTDPESGRRSYVYGSKAVSLEAVVGEDEERSGVLGQRDDTDGSIDYVQKALTGRALREVDEVVKVAKCLVRGMDVAAISAKLGLEQSHICRYERLIWRASPPDTHQCTSISQLRERLEERARFDAAMAMRVADLLAASWAHADVALELGIEMGELNDHAEAIKVVTERNR